jgi:hypothetical protein
MDKEKKMAQVRLGKHVDRSKAPEKDFVLFFRGCKDDSSDPVCLVKSGDLI